MPTTTPNNSSSNEYKRPNLWLTFACMVSVVTMFAFTFSTDRQLTSLEDAVIDRTKEINSLTDFYERTFATTILTVKAINVLKDGIATQGGVMPSKALKAVIDSLQNNLNPANPELEKQKPISDSTETKLDSVLNAPISSTVAVVSDLQASRLKRRIDRLELDNFKLRQENYKNRIESKNLRNVVSRQKKVINDLKEKSIEIEEQEEQLPPSTKY